MGQPEHAANWSSHGLTQQQTYADTTGQYPLGGLKTYADYPPPSAHAGSCKGYYLLAARFDRPIRRH